MIRDLFETAKPGTLWDRAPLHPVLLPSHFPPSVAPVFCAASRENAIFNYRLPKRSAAEKTLEVSGYRGEEGGCVEEGVCGEGGGGGLVEM